MNSTLVDSFKRKHDYLRISITDRCNLRCIYCMGEGAAHFLKEEELLSYEEIVEIAQAAAELGITKLRITGGEPLVRPDVPALVRGLRTIEAIQDLALTTNGMFLEDQAQELKLAGLDRVNISLDSLDPAVFKQVTRGGDLSRVLRGMESALRVGLSPVKLNVVLMKGINEASVADFVALAKEEPIQVRFIEYMPIGEQAGDLYVPITSVLEQLRAYQVVPAQDGPLGNGPADNYVLPGGRGSIGLIHAISHSFCAGCNRLRLTPDGMLKPCLYWPEELPLRPMLGERRKIQAQFRKAMLLKQRQHQMGSGPQGSDSRRMFQIGG